ncbi:MAG: AAA-type ATPase lid domain-containing protein [Planctomycetota bacterium]|jgi:transcriptional regulator with PAS, ATPase and Fis domain
MARQRISVGELAKMLNSATQPVYVLDDEMTLVFCNRACRDWLGQQAEGLVGQRCSYHSGPDPAGPAAVAAGLCPPPGVFPSTGHTDVRPNGPGRHVTANVSCTGPTGEVYLRRATFISLGTSPEDLIGLVAILDEEDLAEPDLSPPPPTAGEARPTDLHEQIRQFRRQAAARYGADRLIGEGPAIRRVRAQIELAAGNRASVLLAGPPGSGRQHVAAAIHYAGDPHSAGSLIPLACSVLGADLVRSTVTALAAKDPLGEQAGQSTLLLNDADQLPLDVQRELAAVLAGRRFRLRLIATAARPLTELVRSGTYRADLAALLSTITVELPPLAERREDLPLLAQLFLEEANARGGRQLAGFTPEALDHLDAYAWPGNLDELAQIVARAHQQAEGPEITPRDLPEQIRLAAEAAAHPPRTEETIVLDEFLARVERELIRRAMAQAKGNKAKAARLLGMTRPRLYRRLLQLGLEEDGGS